MNVEVKKINILIIEQDKELGGSLSHFFQEKNMNVTIELSVGLQIPSILKNNHFDIILVGIPLEGTDLDTLIQKIHKSKEQKTTPFILLSPKDTKDDIIKGLELGADDYIIKPYSIEEVSARVRAVLRRCTISGRIFKENDDDLINFPVGEYILDTQLQILLYTKTKEKIQLTNKENLILKFLCQNINRNIDRKDMLARIWRNDNHQSSRSLDVFITKIRKYLKHDPNVAIINNHSIGHKLVIK
ncbi:MAG: response regulator transcription factor [Chitinophagaceae bacterium]|nr:response regulator transcription factor [Chitinophagaceae bacterium]